MRRCTAWLLAIACAGCTEPQPDVLEVFPPPHLALQRTTSDQDTRYSVTTESSAVLEFVIGRARHPVPVHSIEGWMTFSEQRLRAGRLTLEVGGGSIGPEQLPSPLGHRQPLVIEWGKTDAAASWVHIADTDDLPHHALLTLNSRRSEVPMRLRLRRPELVASQQTPWQLTTPKKASIELDRFQLAAVSGSGISPRARQQLRLELRLALAPQADSDHTETAAIER